MIREISNYLPYLPVFIIIWYFPRLSKAMKLLAMVLILTAVHESASSYAAKVYRNNLGVINVYTLLFIPLMGYAYYTLLKENINSVFHKIIKWSTVGFFLLYFFLILKDGLLHISLYQDFLYSFFPVLCSLIYFYFIIHRDDETDFLQDAFFLCSCAFLIYYMTGVIGHVTGGTGFLDDEPVVRRLLSDFKNSVEILHVLIISVAMLIHISKIKAHKVKLIKV